MLSRASLVLAVLATCGCTANGYCKGEFDYQKAPSVPALKGVEGLKLPESATALKIPAPPAQPVPYGQVVKDKNGDEQVLCLDAPPEMPPPAPPKAELPSPLPKTDTPVPAKPVDKPKP